MIWTVTVPSPRGISKKSPSLLAHQGLALARSGMRTMRSQGGVYLDQMRHAFGQKSTEFSEQTALRAFLCIAGWGMRPIGWLSTTDDNAIGLSEWPS